MTARLRLPLYALSALLALYLLVPIGAFVVRLHSGLSLPAGALSALAVSLLCATIAAALIALGGVPLAYLLARSRSRAAIVLETLVALPLALPPLMSGILLLYIVGPYTLLGRLFGGGLTDSPAGIVLAQTFVAAPFLVISARAAFAAVDPALEEVAATLGHGPLARFMRIALHAAWPGVRAGLLLAWLRAFGEFGATVILAYHPYSLPVYTFVQFDSSGLGGTALPLAVALGAAVVVLAALRAAPALPRRATIAPRRLPPAAPPQARAEDVSFAVQARAGDFTVRIPPTHAGGALALLGPSGSGKTLTLRALCGLVAGAEVAINVGGRELSALAPPARGIGYVPQDACLLPRRTVWEQLTLAPLARAERAAWWLERLGLGRLAARTPAGLSGGQARRVALARALACDPRLVLLDEPFSALDVAVRAELQGELSRLRREAGFATVLVSHDPEEAARLAEQVVVIEEGRVLQSGPLSEVFTYPASTRVAALVGTPNVFAGEVTGARTLRAAGLELPLPGGERPPGSQVMVAIAPEAIAAIHEGAPEHGRALEATVLEAVPMRGSWEARLAVGRLSLLARGSGLARLSGAGRLRVLIDPAGVRCWAA